MGRPPPRRSCAKRVTKDPFDGGRPLESLLTHVPPRDPAECLARLSNQNLEEGLGVVANPLGDSIAEEASSGSLWKRINDEAEHELVERRSAQHNGASQDVRLFFLRATACRVEAVVQVDQIQYPVDRVRKVLDRRSRRRRCKSACVECAEMAKLPKYIRNTGKSWTARETRQLRELARQNTPTRVIGLKLGRTEASARTKAAERRVSLGTPARDRRAR